MAKKILISTGGSGGHVIPATVFFDHLKDKFEVFISSDLRGSKYLNKNQFNPIIIDSPKISNNIPKWSQNYSGVRPQTMFLYAM